MASNVETHSNEKDAGSLDSSVNARIGAARNLDERRRAALAHIDGANFSFVFFFFWSHHFPRADISLRSWFHFKVICVAGAGFFTDA